MNHYKLFLASIAIAASFCSEAGAQQSQLSIVGAGYAKTSVNTTIFRGSSIVSQGEWQYTAYYNADGYLTMAKRKISGEKPGDWEAKVSAYRGHVEDAHNVISIGIDGEGVLHVSFDHHGNKLRYCKSVAPGSLKLGDEQAMVGNNEHDVTYPEFHKLGNGDMMFVYRSGASGRGNLVMNRYSLATHKWQRVHDILIDGEGKRNAYWQMCTDKEGVIHLSWVWRETWMVETNHDLCYARSRDGGVTWERSDGTPYTLPITLETAEKAWDIPQKSELINQTSMACDNEGNPYIATYWKEKGGVPQYRVVWNDGKKWQMRQVSSRTSNFSLAGGGTKMIPMSRPRMVVDGRRAWYIVRDAEYGSRVALYQTSDIINGEWQRRDLTDFSVDAWEPSIDLMRWQQEHKLSIFVQESHQGDGEKKVEALPELAYILDADTTFTTSAPLCQKASTYGFFYRDMKDDIAWENDMVGFRAYGPELQRRKENGYGYDLFVKHTDKPALADVYDKQCNPDWNRRINKMRSEGKKKEAQMLGDSITYHIDHGVAIDCYGVGPTFGAGITALLSSSASRKNIQNSDIIFPYCYKSYEILENGPKRFRVKLTFNPTVIEGDTVTEVRIITLDEGNCLNHTQVRYEGLRHPMTLLAGMVIHSDDANDRSHGKRWMAYADPTQHPDGRYGTIFIGQCYKSKPSFTTFVPYSKSGDVIRGNYVSGFKIKPGDTFEYWWGFGWSKRGWTREQWEKELEKF